MVLVLVLILVPCVLVLVLVLAPCVLVLVLVLGPCVLVLVLVLVPGVLETSLQKTETESDSFCLFRKKMAKTGLLLYGILNVFVI